MSFTPFNGVAKCSHHQYIMELNNIGKRIFNSTIIYGIGDLITKGAAVLLIPFYTHQLTASDYGIIASVGIFSSLLSNAMGLTLGAAITKMAVDYENPQEQNDYCGTVFLSGTIWAFFFAAILTLFGEQILAPLFKSISFDPYLKLGVWITFFSCSAQIPLALLQIQERPLAYRFFTFSSFVVTTLLIIWFVAFQKEGVLGSLKGQMIGSAIAFIAYTIFMFINMNFIIRLSMLSHAVSFAIPLVLYNFGSFVMVGSGRYFLERYASTDEVGFYNLAYQYSAILGMVIAAFNMSWTPIFYKLSRIADGRATIARVAQLMVAFSVFIGLGMVLFSPEVFTILTPKQYHAAVDIVPYLVFVNVLTPAIWVNLGHAIATQNKNAHLVWITTISCLVVVVLCVLFVPTRGLMGSAVATLISYLVFNLLALIIAQKCFYVAYQYYRVLAVIILAILFISVSTYLSFLPFSTLLAMRLILLVVQLSATLCLFVDKNDLRYILGLFKIRSAGVG